MTTSVLVTLGILGAGLALYSSICSVRQRRVGGPVLADGPSGAALRPGPHSRRLFVETLAEVPAMDLTRVSGLAKYEAEELLDWLEANHYLHCELSYVEGEGFAVSYG